jgi:hypothetical protein
MASLVGRRQEFDSFAKLSDGQYGKMKPPASRRALELHGSSEVGAIALRGFEFGPRAKEVQERRALVAALKLLVLGIGQENRYRRAVGVIICGPSCAALIKALSSALTSCTCHTDFIGLRITESDHGSEQDVNDAVARSRRSGVWGPTCRAKREWRRDQHE